MRCFTDEEKELIDKMYNDGERIDDIRSRLHCNEGLLRNYLKENGYKRRKRNTVNGKERLGASRKHFFDTSYFENINTEEKAYWLGFLYADGNVSFGKYKNNESKGCKVEIALAEKDSEHLKKFLYCINADENYPIEKREVKLNDKIFISHRLSLSSIKMGEDLVAHGCVPNKSLKLKPPSIDEKLIRHFIRGYFDGDGCVSINKELGNTIYTIIGTKDILSFIQDNSGISQKISISQVRRNNEYKPFYQITIGGIRSKLIFHDYIYRDANIFLDRKYYKSCDVYNYLLETKNIA